MHGIQEQLLRLAQTHDLRALGLREIGRLLDANNPIHPQKVKHHLQKLNILEKNSEKVTQTSVDDRFVSIPIYGLANCGPATFFANWSTPIGHVQVSRSLLSSYTPDFFAVKAVGSSLNKANINGKNIETGDYVIVNPLDKDFKNGDYVLSLINGLANLKKFYKAEDGKSVVLTSESDESFPPIFIQEGDLESYIPSAKVVEVLKHPKFESEQDLVIEEL